MSCTGHYTETDMEENKIPSTERYNEAKIITMAFEKEQERLFQLKLLAFKNELQDYFNENDVEGYKITDFHLRKNQFGSYQIVPVTPCIEEDYDGSNNADIEKICLKHGIDAKFIYWMYHK